MDSRLHIIPITQSEAFEFVTKYHRHHRKPVGSVFQIACAAQYDACDIKSRKEIKIYEIAGVVIVGRPVARRLDNGYTLEVNRLCTDGTPNACSILYSAAWRAAKALGWTRLITYILSSENGASLYASNWKLIGERGGGTWNKPSRPRIDKHSIQKKMLFEAV